MSIYVSKYLNIYPSKEGNIILFHGISGAIDEVNSVLGKILAKSQKNGGLLKEEISESVLSFLMKRQHITHHTPAQEITLSKKIFEKLHAETLKSREKKGLLMLIPSYDCNLACPYCYQCKIRENHKGKNNKIMTVDDINLIFSKALKNLFPKVERASAIDVTLYGGEPFLKQNKNIIRKIIEYTRKHQMYTYAISNATTIHELTEFVGKERGLVNWIQVSFDGDKEFHDKSRVTKNSEGTFLQIIENIHNLVNKGIKVKVRINTNKDNIACIEKLYHELEKEELMDHPNLSIYAAAIHTHADDSEGLKNLVTQYRLASFVGKTQLKISTPLHRVKQGLRGLFEADCEYPLRKTHFCMQNNVQSYVVDPFKRIYACYEEAGKPELAIGFINNDGSVELNERYVVYQKRNLHNLEVCSKCSVALTCAGGCAANARGKDKSIEGVFKNNCNSHKELVAKAIQELFDEKKNNMSAQYKHQNNCFVEQPLL